MKRFGNDPMRIDYCPDCGVVADECEKVSVCCGSPEDFGIEGFCPQCRDNTGFECKEEPDAPLGNVVGLRDGVACFPDLDLPDREVNARTRQAIGKIVDKWMEATRLTSEHEQEAADARREGIEMR